MHTYSLSPIMLKIWYTFKISFKFQHKIVIIIFIELHFACLKLKQIFIDGYEIIDNVES